MATKGDLIFLLDVDTTQYERGFDRAEKRMPHFEATMKRSLQRLPDVDRAIAGTGQSAAGAIGNTKNLGRAFLELSRGVEDAASVYGTMGLAGAFRASSNNLSQFASIIHPAAGAVTGLAVAAGSVLIPKLFEQDEKVEESKEKVRTLSEEISHLRENMEKGFSLQATVDAGPQAIEESIKQLDRREKFETRQLERLRNKRQSILEQYGEDSPVSGQRVMRTKPANRFEKALLEEATKREFELREQISDIEGRRGDIRAERLSLSTNLGAARIKEAKDQHAKQRARDIALAREEERDLKAQDEKERMEAEKQAKKQRDEAARRAEQQQKLREEISDDLDPSKGRERTILQQLRDRRREIDDLFGGDANLTAQAEAAARQKLLGLEKPTKLPAGSPAAFEAGSAAAAGLIARNANEARPVEKQQLGELQKLNTKVTKLIDSTRHPADLPPADIAGG